MTDTPNLALPYILAAQAQKHVTHNEAIRAIDCLVQLSVESRVLTSPPASPAEGSRYVVAAGASGDWTGQNNKIAAFQDGAWAFYAPKDGWIAWVASENVAIVYAASSWSPLPANGLVTDHGALTGLADDDHPQYLTNARGDARYDVLGAASAGDAAHVAASDPHPQYLTQAEGDAAYAALSHGHAIAAITGLQAALDGKADDATTLSGYGITDAYTKTETDARIQTVVGAAPAALDTLKEIADQLASDESAVGALTTVVAGKEASGTAAAAVAAHVAASDPHTQYHDNTRGDARYTPISPTTLGINATADTTNRLALSSPASLFSHEGNGHQVKVNKNAASDTASFLFQDNFSGRAEIGLTGDDDFHFKVSSDGSTWFEGIKIARATGKVSFPNSGGPREVLAANRTYYVRTDGSDSNNGLANTSGGALLTLQKAYNILTGIDLGGFTGTIQLADGTYAGGLDITIPVIGGNVVINGNSSTPSNVLLGVTSANAIHVAAPVNLTIQNFKIQTTTSGHGVFVEVSGATLTIGTGMNFGAVASSYAHIAVVGRSQVNRVANYTISGGGATHLDCSGGFVNAGSNTVTLTGTPAFSSAFVISRNTGAVVEFSTTYSGSATGVRYSAATDGVINTFGGGASHFPGNSAGTTATGGQYV